MNDRFRDLLNAGGGGFDDGEWIFDGGNVNGFTDACNMLFGEREFPE